MGRGGDAAGFVEASSPGSGGPLVTRARGRVGSTLRRKWHLDALLGVGGMAAVYAATHRNGRRAALKVLHPELSLDRETRGRFLREGRVANAVRHDGAVKVLDDDATDDGSVFLVLELLEGENLEERCVRLGGRLPENEVLWIADQLLDVLVVAHARGIVHRDIKPDNLFLTSSGNLKVLDFGIARLRELSTASAATHSGGTMGTPAFMAPEQARGLWDEVDAQSDLFAVGATMFTLLTGRSVHEGRTQNEEMLSAMTVPAPRVSSIVPGVAETLARAIDRALAFEKADRWPDAQRMQEAVREAYRDRTGRRISMAPRPVVPDVASNAINGLSRDMRASKPSAFAKPNVLWLWGRPLGVAVAIAAGVAAVVAVAVPLVRPGYSISPAAAGIEPEPPVVSSPSPPPGGAVVEDPSSSAPEAPAVAATSTRPASSPVGSQKSPSAPKPSVAPACDPPFVVDPATHIKHWKIDCL